MRQRLFRFKPFISDFRLLYTSLVSRLANCRIFLLVFPLLMFIPLYFTFITESKIIIFLFYIKSNGLAATGSGGTLAFSAAHV